jgi:hypothetical protein
MIFVLVFLISFVVVHSFLSNGLRFPSSYMTKKNPLSETAIFLSTADFKNGMTFELGMKYFEVLLHFADRFLCTFL